MRTRRNFIKTVGSAAIASCLLPETSFSQPKFTNIGKKNSPNETIRVGLIGCRNMGWSDLSDFLVLPNTECAALCDIDSNVLNNRAAEIAKQGQKPQIFGDERKMLEIKDLDVVIIGTPDHWHCLQLVDACSAGKDVYVEKPIANSIAECDAMVKAARKYNRIVSVGQQQRSGNHWHEMIRYINSGKLGKIARVDIWANFNYGALAPSAPISDVPEGVDYDMWMGPTPKRPFCQSHFHGSWRMFWNYGGGLMTDWGVHLIDMALWGMNITKMPNYVTAVGGRFAYPQNCPETFDTQSVLYQFDDFLIQWNHTGGTETGPYGRNYGLAFKGTNGTLIADRDNWEIIPERSNNTDKIERISVKADYKDHLNHLANFLECVRNRNQQTACTLENGSLCAKYAHLGNIAARTKLTLTYDDTKKRFDNKHANKFLKPRYQNNWKFPEL